MPRAQIYTVDDKTAQLPVLCRLFGISENVVRRRMSIGWSVEDALKTPVRVFRTKEKTPTPYRRQKGTPPPARKREVVWVQTGSASGYYDWK